MLDSCGSLRRFMFLFSFVFSTPFSSYSLFLLIHRVSGPLEFSKRMLLNWKRQSTLKFDYRGVFCCYQSESRHYLYHHCIYTREPRNSPFVKGSSYSKYPLTIPPLNPTIGGQNNMYMLLLPVLLC